MSQLTKAPNIKLIVIAVLRNLRCFHYIGQQPAVLGDLHFLANDASGADAVLHGNRPQSHGGPDVDRERQQQNNTRDNCSLHSVHNHSSLPPETLLLSTTTLQQ